MTRGCRPAAARSGRGSSTGWTRTPPGCCWSPRTTGPTRRSPGTWPPAASSGATWRLSRATWSPPSPTGTSWSASTASTCWRSAWRAAAPTRSACTWPPSATRSWATAPTPPTPTWPSASASTAPSCTPGAWPSPIPSPGTEWRSRRSRRRSFWPRSNAPGRRGSTRVPLRPRLRELVGGAASQGRRHAVEDDAGPTQVGLADLSAQRVGPGTLGRLDGAQGGVAGGADPQQLGAPVGGVLLVGRVAVPHQHVRHALHALPGQAQPSGDLRHRRRRLLDRLEHQPARERLAGGPGERLPGGGEVPDEPDDLHDHGGEGIPRWHPGRRVGRRVDSMLSFW